MGIGSCGAGDTDCGLADTAGCGVDQNPVAGADPGLIMQAEPGGGGGRGDSDRLMISQISWKRGSQASVAGDKRSPTAILGETADPVADVMIGDTRTDRCDYAGEIHPQFR
jgi:hypothetical protein